MKQLFFVAIAVAIPAVLGGALMYMFFHGIYTMISDWRLRKELKQIEQESSTQRNRQTSTTADASTLAESASLADSLPVANSPPDDAVKEFRGGE